MKYEIKEKLSILIKFNLMVTLAVCMCISKIMELKKSHFKINS